MSEGKKEVKAEGGIATELFLWAQALVLSLVVLVLLNIFIIRISGVVGSSMLPTLHEGDRLLVQVAGYNTPQRGDIIVVSAPDFDTEPLVKRIIAVGGDTINIDQTTGTVYVNGEPLYEPYIAEQIRDAGNNSYPFDIPEGYVFFMGDNRNRSTDSRWRLVGIQPESNIVGKVLCRIWPIKSIGGVK